MDHQTLLPVSLNRPSQSNQGRCFGFAEAGPSIHELAPLLEQIAAPIGGFGLVADGMRQRLLADLVRE